MIQSLPVFDFKFLSEKEINSFNLDSISGNSSTGYILECNLEYCKELHDLHSVYPLFVLYVFIMSRTSLRVNPHSTVA